MKKPTYSLLLCLSIFLAVSHGALALTNFDQSCLVDHPDCAKLRSEVPKDFENAAALQDFMDSAAERSKYECIIKSRFQHPNAERQLACQEAVKHFVFHQECRTDILKLCSKIDPGQGRTHECLAKQAALKKLSPRCEKNIAMHLHPMMVCSDKNRARCSSKNETPQAVAAGHLLSEDEPDC